MWGYRDCHTGPVKLMTIGKASIWAGGVSEVLDEPSWALMVSCAGGGSAFTPSNPIKANAQARTFIPKDLIEWTPPPLISIEWDDGSVPQLAKSWWESFYKFIATVEGNVVFYCFGGHGRTGTALSILAGLGGLQKHGCPVMWVRKHYCMEAVETYGQIDYIEAMTGKKVKVQPSYIIKKAQEDAAKAAAYAKGGATVSGAANATGRTYVAGADGVLQPMDNFGELEYGDTQDWEKPHHKM